MNADRFAKDGYTLVRGVLSEPECDHAAGQIRLADRGAGGTRCLLVQAWCAALAARLRMHPALTAALAPDLVAVQCNYFEKSAGRNWLVPIHQDLSIPVAARVIDPALGGWSEKEGVLFVRPPLAVLRQLVAVRVHLDRCDVEDGPLRVVSGSHQHGLIADKDAIASRVAGLEVTCLAAKGDALVMRPLLLHASSKGSGEGRRRVLHFVYGPPELPCGLKWNVAV